MTRFAAPTADPHGLRGAARRLTEVGQDLQVNGAHLGTAATATLSTWQGTASVLMAGRAQRLRSSSDHQELALRRVAQVTERYADEVEKAQTEVRRLNELWDEAQFRASQQAAEAERAAHAATDDARATGAQWQSRASPWYDDGSTRLADTLAELEQRYVRITENLEQDGFSLERALSDRDPMSFLPAWVAGGFHTADAAVKASGVTRRTVALGRYTGLLWQASRFFSLEHEAVRAGIRASAEHRALLQALHGKPSSAPIVGRPLTATGKAFLPMTVITGAIDVATGGGHEGWRDPATRVAGASGALGASALIASGVLGIITLTPVGLAAAGAAVIGYSAWSLGNLVYDNRAAMGAFLSRAREALVHGASSARTEVRRTVSHAKGVLVSSGRHVAGAVAHAAATGRSVVDVLTPPGWLVPRVVGPF